MFQHLISLLPVTMGALAIALFSFPTNASELKITIGGKSRSLTASKLFARGDASELTIPADIAYGTQMTYKAVPLLAVLGAANQLDFDTLEARATDGFVSQLPMTLVKKGADGGAVAWIAIEPAKNPWPQIPKKSISAGPFYLVWQHPEKSAVGPEQWPYALAELRGVRSPMQRWPQMVVQSPAKKHAAAHRGLPVYVKHCLSCHRIAGAGEASVGPDMALPMSPTVYMTEAGLRALIRNPAAVRSWPNQQMQGFAADVLPDAQLYDLIEYLRYMAHHTATSDKTK